MVEIVAEAANGHEGSEAHLMSLVELAGAAGADAVKFQLVFADELCTSDHALYALFRRQELSSAAWHAATTKARAADCRFYVDVFGTRSASLADEICADAVKVHASDVANRSLIETIAMSNVPRVLLSAGGAIKREIEAAINLLAEKDVVLIHGFQAYPTTTEDNQLARIWALRALFPNVPLGFADHVPFDEAIGMWLAAVAVGAGATLIEKHLTIASVLQAVDHQAALNPDDFARFASNMRAAFGAVGTADASLEDFGMSAAERSYRANVRKSLVASRNLRAGEILMMEDLDLKRSGRPQAAALDPEEVIGRRLTADIRANEPIHHGLLDGSE